MCDATFMMNGSEMAHDQHHAQSDAQPKACSGKCRGTGGCANKGLTSWVVVAGSDRVRILRRNREGVHPESAVLHVNEAADMLTRIHLGGSAEQWILVGDKPTMNTLIDGLPTQASSHIVAEMLHEFQPAHFDESALDSLTQEVNRLLA